MTPQRPNVESPKSEQRLNPDWIVGFIDGEGCFHVGISRHPEVRFGYQIPPELTVVQHQRDIDLLHSLRSAMKCGVVRRNHGDRYCWRVRDLKNLAEVIVPFFDKFGFLSAKKKRDYSKFKQLVELLVQKQERTPEGIRRILEIRRDMNDGGNRRYNDEQILAACRDVSESSETIRQGLPVRPANKI